jgi:1-acyl-sn-glycerol-3-phosphate acyltransferase
MLYSLCRLALAIIINGFFRLQIKGKEHIPRDEPFILASNHVSYLDPLVLGVGIKQHLFFLAREDLMRKRVFRFFLTAVGSIPIKRGASDVTAMKQAIKVLTEGSPLVIFPQGQRGPLEDVKAGVGFLAKKTSVPLVVARIFGTDRALPKGSKRLRVTKITVVFDRLNDIDPRDSYEDIAHKLLERMKELVYH